MSPHFRVYGGMSSCGIAEILCYCGNPWPCPDAPSVQLDALDKILADSKEEDKQMRREIESDQMLDWLADHWTPGHGDGIEKAFYEGNREKLREEIRKAMKERP